MRAGKEKSRVKIVGSLKVERKSESWGEVGYETEIVKFLGWLPDE
jgi:hypothetical protein